MSRIESGLPGGQGLDSIFSTHALSSLGWLAGWSSLGLDSMSRIESGLPGGQGLDSIFSTHVLSSLGCSSLGLDSIDCVLLDFQIPFRN